MQQHLHCPFLLEELGEGSLVDQLGGLWEAACAQPKPLVLGLGWEPLLGALCSHRRLAEPAPLPEGLGGMGMAQAPLPRGSPAHTGAVALGPVGEILVFCLCQISVHSLVFNMSAQLLDFIS